MSAVLWRSAVLTVKLVGYTQVVELDFNNGGYTPHIFSSFGKSVGSRQNHTHEVQ